MNLVQEHIRRSIAVKQLLLETASAQIAEAGSRLSQVFKNGGTLLTCGNGGSAGDSQHIATEFLIRYRAKPERPSLPAISLPADVTAITATGNDFGFENIFSRQIEGLGRQGDALLAITTSGNSDNILRAVDAAKKKQMVVIVLTGETGGRLAKEMSSSIDYLIRIPTAETARIQECHIMIGQIFCAIVEKDLYGFD